MDSLESAWLKWAWGVVQLDRLGLEINAFAKDAHRDFGITFAQEYHPKRHCIVISVDSIFDPLFPDEWGLRLGDLVHSFRSALDHLAWALYERGSKFGTLTERQERLIQYPICTSNWQRFRDTLNRQIPGIRRADRTIVRLSQPYRHGKRNLPRHPLFVLNELSRFDKHRWFQPVIANPVGGDFLIRETIDCDYRYTRPSRRRELLQPGTELALMFVKKTGPEPRVDMEPGFTFDPSISERLTVEQFGIKTEKFVRAILSGYTRRVPQRARDILKLAPSSNGRST